MACGGFGKAPQTGEAEGLLTSSGNVTHFSRGEEPWAGGADVAQMSLHARTHTQRHAHTYPACTLSTLPLFSIKIPTERESVAQEL